MAGDSEGQGSVSDQGIHFEATSYTLFRGTYGTANFVINLPDNIQFMNQNTQIIFAKGSGEINGVNSVILKDTNDGSQKTITINPYGVITGVN